MKITSKHDWPSADLQGVILLSRGY